MAGTVEHLEPVYSLEVHDPTHADHPMRVVTEHRSVSAAIDLSAGMPAEAPPGLAPWVRAARRL